MDVPHGLGEFAAAIPYGLGFGLGLLAVRLLAMVIAQWNVKEERLDNGSKTLIEQLTAEVKRLAVRLETVESDLAECKKLHAETESQLMQMRAMNMGLGDARQHAALIVADEKRKDREQ